MQQQCLDDDDDDDDDDAAVGSPDGNGDGARILRGDCAFDVYLGNSRRPSNVWLRIVSRN
jgi:hypothetical protein